MAEENARKPLRDDEADGAGVQVTTRQRPETSGRSVETNTRLNSRRHHKSGLAITRRVLPVLLLFFHLLRPFFELRLPWTDRPPLFAIIGGKSLTISQQYPAVKCLLFCLLSLFPFC